VNIITPYMPITTDGKAPDLSVLADEIVRTITRSVNKAKRESPKGPNNDQFKTMVRAHLAAAIGETSGGGYAYKQRQLFYVVRRIISHLGGGELLYGNFKKIVTEYESEIGHDLPGMYRDDRGTLYHPHTGELISLGSQMVEFYKPPDWTYNKVLYIEKEGFYGILRAAKWPERHDCALLTSKGQATRAAKDLIDLLGPRAEGMTFYCAHDADAAGTVIYEALQEATKARPARKVRIVNIGLEPEEGLETGLEPEVVGPQKGGGRRAVASYVSAKMTEWLQTNRVELNAMTTPQFLKWLDEKVGDEKLIPPESVMVDELNKQAEEKLKQDITDQILKEQDLDGQVRTALEAMKPAIDEKAKELPKVIVDALDDDPTQSWRDPVKNMIEGLVAQRSKTKETT